MPRTMTITCCWASKMGELPKHSHCKRIFFFILLSTLIRLACLRAQILAFQIQFGLRRSEHRVQCDQSERRTLASNQNIKVKPPTYHVLLDYCNSVSIFPSNRNLQDGSIEVDGGQAVSRRSPGKLRQLNTDTGLYVGECAMCLCSHFNWLCLTPAMAEAA